MNDQLNKWLVEKGNLPASLAAAIVNPDKTTFTHFFSRSFSNILKENVWLGLIQMAEIASAHRLPASHLRWQFQNAFVYGSFRPDGTCALIITSRNLSIDQAATLESLLSEFRTL